jgi:flagellar protein FliS
MRSALKQYQAVNIDSEVNSASPYRITQMLLEGCIRFMRQAKIAIEKKDLEKKSEFISKSQAIVATLGGSLEKDASPELTDNLGALYQYVNEQLIAVSLDLDVNRLESCEKVISEIKKGWDAIPAEEIARAEAIRNS